MYLESPVMNEQSCACLCNCCPCKLKETDFSKDPKKVGSKPLPRGPFHIDGHIVGPLRFRDDGEFVLADRQLQGVFELRSDSDNDTKSGSENPSCPVKNKNPDKHERATWISKEHVKKPKEASTEPEGGKKINFLLTDDELNIRRIVHDKATCKYCGLIPYLLKSKTPSKNQNSSDGSAKIGYWPQQFAVRADVHREDVISSKNSLGSQKTAPSASSTPISLNSRKQQGQSGPTAASTPVSSNSRKLEGQSLNLALPSIIRPGTKNVTKSSDNYFETKIPIYLKDFKGEVKTGIEVFKKNKVNNQQAQDSSNPLEPFVVVATEVKIHKI